MAETLGRSSILSDPELEAFQALVLRRDTIDEEIKKLEEEIVTLKAEKNTLTTASLAVKFDVTHKQMIGLCHRFNKQRRGD